MPSVKLQTSRFRYTTQEIYDGVVYGPPPTTGSIRCSCCGGWIAGPTSYSIEGETYCPKCYFATIEAEERREPFWVAEHWGVISLTPLSFFTKGLKYEKENNTSRSLEH